MGQSGPRLPSLPGVLGPVVGGIRQQWLQGAFGDRTTLEGLGPFRVVRDEWAETDDGVTTRTIHEAVVLDQHFKVGDLFVGGRTWLLQIVAIRGDVCSMRYKRALDGPWSPLKPRDFTVAELAQLEHLNP